MHMRILRRQCIGGCLQYGRSCVLIFETLQVAHDMARAERDGRSSCTIHLAATSAAGLVGVAQVGAVPSCCPCTLRLLQFLLSFPCLKAFFHRMHSHVGDPHIHSHADLCIGMARLSSTPAAAAAYEPEPLDLSLKPYNILPGASGSPGERAEGSRTGRAGAAGRGMALELVAMRYMAAAARARGSQEKGLTNVGPSEYALHNDAGWHVKDVCVCAFACYNRLIPLPLPPASPPILLLLLTLSLPLLLLPLMLTRGQIEAALLISASSNKTTSAFSNETTSCIVRRSTLLLAEFRILQSDLVCADNAGRRTRGLGVYCVEQASGAPQEEATLFVICNVCLR
jgi:hypothetical protein